MESALQGRCRKGAVEATGGFPARSMVICDCAHALAAFQVMLCCSTPPMRFSFFARALTAAALFLVLHAARGTPVDTANFTETSFILNSNLGLPTGLGWAPDGSGRLFVIRKAGEVRIVQ